MAQQKLNNVALVNELTGEVYDVFLAKRNRAGGKWMKIWQDGKRELLSRNPNLSKEGFRILNNLETVVNWENIIPPPPVLAKKLGFSETAVYRAYAELIKGGFVLKQERVYYLSPAYCWKGTQKQWENACRKLLSPSLLLPTGV